MNEALHRELREQLGWYAIGNHSDATALEAHLDGCATCREELAELRETVGRLAHIDLAHLEHVAAPPPDFGDAVVRAVLASYETTSQVIPLDARRAPRWNTRFLLAAAAAALVLGGVTGWLTKPSDVPVIPYEAVAVQPRNGSINAKAGVVPHTWGMEIKLDGTGFTAGAGYKVSVLTPSGERPAGEFIGTGENFMKCNLNSSVLRGDATGFKVVDAAGGVVLTSAF